MDEDDANVGLRDRRIIPRRLAGEIVDPARCFHAGQAAASNGRRADASPCTAAVSSSATIVLWRRAAPLIVFMVAAPSRTSAISKKFVFEPSARRKWSNSTHAGNHEVPTLS